MTIIIEQNGIAVVSPLFRYLLPKVWQAIQQNYFYHSYQNIYSNASKLQRWWRKASGFYIGFELMQPNNFPFCIAPILYRQSIQCEPEVSYNEVPYYREQGFTSDIQAPEAWHKDSDFMTCHLQIQMITELKIINGWVCKNTPKRFNKRSCNEMSQEHIYNLAKNHTRGFNRNPFKKICCCSDPKASDYIRQIGSNNKYIIKIFEILAGDEINVKTRIKLSKFIQKRLS
jgi:hypothetical protein